MNDLILLSIRLAAFLCIITY